MYEIKSKKTGKVQYIDELTHDRLKANGELRKYNIIGKVVPRKINMEEIIQRKITGAIPKITKKTNDRQRKESI